MDVALHRLRLSLRRGVFGALLETCNQRFHVGLLVYWHLWSFGSQPGGPRDLCDLVLLFSSVFFCFLLFLVSGVEGWRGLGNFGCCLFVNCLWLGV